MISICNDVKYIYVWGSLECADRDAINEYVKNGYRIVSFSNGTGNIEDCMKEIIKSYNQI